MISYPKLISIKNFARKKQLAQKNFAEVISFITGYERILIIGACGAGKSTLAKKISLHTELPVLHLDTIYYLPGWKHIDQTEFMQRQSKFLTQNNQWIIDGNYQSTLKLRLAAAEAIIILNPAPWLCAVRMIYRRITFYGTAQPYNNPACHERFDTQTLHLLKYILGYRRKSLPKVQALLLQYPHLACVYIA